MAQMLYTFAYSAETTKYLLSARGYLGKIAVFAFPVK